MDCLFDLPESSIQAQARVRPCDSVPSAIDEIRALWKGLQQTTGQQRGSEHVIIIFLPTRRTWRTSWIRSATAISATAVSTISVHGYGQQHKISQCLHINSTCFQCGIKGHIARVCRKKSESANSVTGKNLLYHCLLIIVAFLF